jgi:hypothetical protein
MMMVKDMFLQKHVIKNNINKVRINCFFQGNILNVIRVNLSIDPLTY